jgi:hypothetical protein
MATLKPNDVIVYNPMLTETIGNHLDFSIGVVMGYDEYADCYDIDIGSDVLQAVIIPSNIARDNLRVVGTL